MPFVGHLGHQGGEALPVGPVDMGYNRKQPPGAGVEVGGLKLSRRRPKKKKKASSRQKRWRQKGQRHRALGVGVSVRAARERAPY